MSDRVSSSNGSLWGYDHDAQIFDCEEQFLNSSAETNPDQQIMLCQPTAAPADAVANHSFDLEDISVGAIFTSAGGSISAEPTAFPLLLWFNSEASSQNHTSGLTASQQLSNTRASALRKLTVGFSIGKLLQHLRASVSSYTQDELLRLCSVDNFTVHLHPDGAADESWEVAGAGMVSPPMSLKLTLKDFDSSNFFLPGNEKDNWGRDVDALITRHSPFCCAKQAVNDESQNDDFICCAFGVLLRFIFSGECLEGGNNSESSSNPQEVDGCMGDFLRSLSISPEDMNLGSNKRRASHQHQDDFNYYHVVSQLVKDLLDFAPNNCLTLDAAINDIHRLLQEPTRFLFESNHQLATATKMYGRSVEVKAILDAFCRVSSTRQSESFMIKGYSGSGKSRLVHSVSESVNAANGLMVSTKFEEGSSNQLSLALSAFDDLCIMLAESLSVSEGGPAHLWRELMFQFGTNFHVLVSTLPSVVRLAPSPIAAFSLANNRVESGGDVNFFSLCDIIKRFMRAVATTFRPIMIFWDDMQWCDSVSLGLMHAVLSDNKGGNSGIFFAGSYRDNEVDDEHVLQGFFSWLSVFHVPVNTICLGGLPDVGVLELVSYSLGVLPRLCNALSQVVHRKTEGNPFFVQTFLRSLVDKHMLVYSFREKSWVWDMNEICAENIMPNVVELLSHKLSNLSEDSQNALKVAACFGIKIGMTVAKTLSRKQQYSTLVVALNNVVEDGLMDLSSDTNGSSYRFAHDKVREAAYDMISQDERNRYHFDVGMALLESRSKEKNHDLLVILDQVNFGVPSLLHDETQRLAIAELNYEAAYEMMKGSNFTSAYRLANTSVMLLPEDSWAVQYDLSLKFYILLAKAANSYRKIDEAKATLNKILEHAKSLQTKLDVYSLHNYYILGATMDRNEATQMTVAIVGVLKMMGEHLPYKDLSNEEINDTVQLAAAGFQSVSDDDLVDTKVGTPEHYNTIMQAYSILLFSGPLAKPSLHPYFASKWAMYFLKYRADSIYIPEVCTHFAVIMCRDINSDTIQLGRRIGRFGLTILHQSSLISQLPLIYWWYYGHVGILFEPLQACIEMHEKAYSIAQRIGNQTLASLHKQYLVVRRLRAGVSLLELREVLENAVNMTEYNQLFPLLGMRAQFYLKTISMLIGDEPLSEESDEGSNSVPCDHNHAFFVSRMIRFIYLGLYERANYTARCWERSSSKNTALINPDRIDITFLHTVNYRTVYVYFYWGIASIGYQRKRKTTKKERAPESAYRSIDIVRKASECSKWNWANKLSLLMAEKYSFTQNNRMASVHYDAAINASKSSHFVHEEGLACELAGNHYERLGNTAKALSLFQQAEQCYERWGSTVKTRHMAEKISKLMP